MKKARVFSRAMKLSAVKRMLDGEDVSALARELKLRRTMLYKWRDRYRKGGAQALRQEKGRPRKSESIAGEAPTKVALDLASAKRRIAELERKIGQQELELDFFQRALRQVEEERRPSGARGAKPSTSSSKR
jgi:transposase-like protein